MEEKPPVTVNILEREKYHSMLNMEVIGDQDVVIIDNDKEYEDPTKIFVKSRVTVRKKSYSLHFNITYFGSGLYVDVIRCDSLRLSDLRHLLRRSGGRSGE